jgi:hypothetical protein
VSLFQFIVHPASVRLATTLPTMQAALPYFIVAAAASRTGSTSDLQSGRNTFTYTDDCSVQAADGQNYDTKEIILSLLAGTNIVQAVRCPIEVISTQSRYSINTYSLNQL